MQPCSFVALFLVLSHAQHMICDLLVVTSAIAVDGEQMGEVEHSKFFILVEMELVTKV